uniref:Uncharacterized protein At4g02000 family n=1 Tax=Cajanus cajan TaxID=3821 RepID=A0A151SRP7_CAJCA|nr:Uncharacterized protein At4g02000 family [Cajanus cajan]
MRMIDMPDDFFLVQFTAEDDYRHALYEGPWMIADHYILVQRWRPFFTITSTQTRKVAAWIRIIGLPIELYNDRFLWRVGNKLGSMLKIDKLTSIHSRGKFARICVEVNLNKKLVSMINVLGYVIKLEYEGLHAICFKCGKYGHRQEQCVDPLGQTPGSADNYNQQNTGAMAIDSGEQVAPTTIAQPKAAQPQAGTDNIPPHNDTVSPRQQHDSSLPHNVSHVNFPMKPMHISATTHVAPTLVQTTKIRNPKSGKNTQPIRGSGSSSFGGTTKAKSGHSNHMKYTKDPSTSMPSNHLNTLPTPSGPTDLVEIQRENSRKVFDGLRSVESSPNSIPSLKNVLTQANLPDAETQAFAEAMRRHLDPTYSIKLKESGNLTRISEVNVDVAGASIPNKSNVSP